MNLTTPEKETYNTRSSKTNINYDNSEKQDRNFGDEMKLTKHNLKNEIKYSETLLELWEDEVHRRDELNLESLTIEKISNQNFFDLVQSKSFKEPLLADKIIAKNFYFDENSINLSNVEINNLKTAQTIANIQQLGNIYSFSINHNNFLSLFEKLDKSKVMNKRQFVMEKKKTNFLNAKRLFKLQDEESSYNSKNPNHIKETDEDTEAIENDTDEVDNIIQSLDEVSLPNNIRSRIGNIATNKSITEFFKSKARNKLPFENIIETSQENYYENSNNANFSEDKGNKLFKIDEQNSSDRELKNKISSPSNNKLKEDIRLALDKINIWAERNSNIPHSVDTFSNNLNKKISYVNISNKKEINKSFEEGFNYNLLTVYKNKLKRKEAFEKAVMLKFFEEKLCNNSFIRILRNFYSFHKLFPDSVYIKQKIENKRSYFYDLRINKYAFDLFYSDLADQEKFLDKKEDRKLIFKLNSNLGEMNYLIQNHTGINYYLNTYNKITKRLDLIISDGINKRKGIIKKLLSKNNLNAEKSQLNCKSLFENFEIIRGQSLIYFPKKYSSNNMSLPTKFDLKQNIGKQKKVRINKLKYDRFLMKYANFKNFYLAENLSNKNKDNVTDPHSHNNPEGIFKKEKENHLEFFDFLPCEKNNEKSFNPSGVISSAVGRDRFNTNNNRINYNCENIIPINHSNEMDELPFYINQNLQVKSDHIQSSEKILNQFSTSALDISSSYNNNYDMDKTLLINQNIHNNAISFYQDSCTNKENLFFDKSQFLDEIKQEKSSNDISSKANKLQNNEKTLLDSCRFLDKKYL